MEDLRTPRPGRDQLRPGDQPTAGPGKEGRPILVTCLACGADISKVCLGGLMPAKGGPTMVVLTPLRCPECNVPMMHRRTVALPPGRRG